MLPCIWAGHYEPIQLKDHDCLEEYTFMGDDAIEKAFDILAPLCAQFGRRPPVTSKFKVPRLKLINNSPKP